MLMIMVSTFKALSYEMIFFSFSQFSYGRIGKGSFVLYRYVHLSIHNNCENFNKNVKKLLMNKLSFIVSC